MRALIIATTLMVFACSSEQDDCLLHSQCASKEQCIEGRCVLPVDAGRPDVGKPDIGPDAAVRDAAQLDVMAQDTQAMDVGGLIDAHSADGGHLDVMSDDGSIGSADAGLMRTDTTTDRGDAIVPLFDVSSPRD